MRRSSRLRYAALSDVGRVRRDNQDSGYAGPHLLVIADGVGGSARGDIASAATVEVLRRLDEPPGQELQGDMLGGLAGAIHRSHDRIAGLVAEDPEIEGTSTTVTAVIFDGTHIGVGHVGDSRGYLLRDGTLSQLTTDHTFVQSLIDEGRITEDEARVHPHRNLILRAVDGVHEPEPDVFTLEVAAGDRILLCSDGCSGVLSDDELARILGEGTPDHVAVSLVSASLDAGSSDNVTVVVADVVDDDAGRRPRDHGVLRDRPDGRGRSRRGTAPSPARWCRVGPGGRHRRARSRSRVAGTTSTPRRCATRRARPVASPGPAGSPYSPWSLVLAAIVGVRRLPVEPEPVLRRRQRRRRRHLPRHPGRRVPGINTHHVEETTTLKLSTLEDYSRRQVEDGISASSLADARHIVSNLRRDSACAPTTTPSTSPSPSSKPSASATAGPNKKKRASQSPTPTPSATPSPSSGTDPCPETP